MSAVLARHQVPRLWELDCPTGTVVRYQRQAPGELVHVDVKRQGRIPEGGGHRMLGKACARGAGSIKGWAMTICMWPSTTAPGLPRWRPWPMSVAAAVLASLLGRWPRPGSAPPDPAVSAQSNGKVERLHHTLNQEWAYARVYHGNQARLDALPGWVHTANHHRPHTALGGRSPMQTSTNPLGTTVSRPWILLPVGGSTRHWPWPQTGAAS